MVAVYGFPIPCSLDELEVGDAFISYGYRSATLAIRVDMGETPYALVLREVGAAYETRLPSLVQLSALDGACARISGDIVAAPTPPMRGAFMSPPPEGTRLGQLYIGPGGLPIVASAINGRLVYVSIGRSTFDGAGGVGMFPAFDAWSLLWRDGTREETLASFSPPAP